MSKRSSQLSTVGYIIAQKALESKGWTKEFLAGLLELSPSTIHNFFAQKPIEKENFAKICVALQIASKEVIDIQKFQNKESIDKLVADIRQKSQNSIIQRCGTMKVLDMTYPIEINHIYTTVNILDKITGIQRKSIDELTQKIDRNNFDRLGLPQVVEKRVPGLEVAKKYEKMIVLGKPGSGKTTFLKHLAIQCISEQIFNNYLPIFLSLKEFADTDIKLKLLDYICQQLADDKVDNNAVISLFESGRVLLLLDGLDEVQQQADDEMRKKHPIDDTNFYTLDEALYAATNLIDNQEFFDEVVKLDEELPQGVYEHWDEYYQWYKNDSGAWANRLKELNKKYRNIDYDWPLNNAEQWGLLRAYCYANKLLLDCLNTQCYVSLDTREYIQETLLLPFNEIEKMMEIERKKLLNRD